MSDVDVMVIGRAGIADLSPALRKAEERLGREVNVTVYSPEEFREKIQNRAIIFSPRCCEGGDSF
jgi:hypothetical protein